MRDLIILRGLPGSGKSQVAELLVTDNTVICSTDDYFRINGVYRFDPTRLPAAHSWCQGKARLAMSEKKSRVIIDNTNTDPIHMQPYEEMGRQYGYRIYHLVVENRHGNRSTHNVPTHTIIRGLDRLFGSLSLAGPDIHGRSSGR